MARWHAAVREPFRSRNATRKVLTLEQKNSEGEVVQSGSGTGADELEASVKGIGGTENSDGDGILAAEAATSLTDLESHGQTRKRAASPGVSDGVLAALAKLRNQ